MCSVGGVGVGVGEVGMAAAQHFCLLRRKTKVKRESFSRNKAPKAGKKAEFVVVQQMARSHNMI